MPLNQRSLIHWEAWFPTCFVRQNQPKKTFFFFWQFKTTSKLKCSNLRPLLSSTFPQGFRISKNFGHPTLGSGGKIGLKIYHMKRDIRQTHRRTSRLYERIGQGPILWKLYGKNGFSVPLTHFWWHIYWHIYTAVHDFFCDFYNWLWAPIS